jgi:hypothetical protein
MGRPVVEHIDSLSEFGNSVNTEEQIRRQMENIDELYTSNYRVS